ncbi:hypothetical protein [Pseudogemmobacter sp. W21_MBD1_M6]|uniref:hypothetical protein n=1 Tax=Pseudogemmobacter sp. W21_MBD1_M6 TaxID=3240271 RepID=UPI003F98F807
MVNLKILGVGPVKLVAAVFIVMAPGNVLHANGFGENRAWQFREPSERANLAAVADLIEKKKGGYYDGFNTIVYSTTTTNIGTQVNCNTLADAKANTADNSQAGNSVDVRSLPSLTTDAAGNKSANSTAGDAGAPSSVQDSSGSVESEVTDSSVSVQTGKVKNGATENDMVNDQFNSGNQTASIDNATTCDMNGAALNGIVDVTTGNISTNGAPLNQDSN